MNLYDETIDILYRHGYIVTDIDWIGGENCYIDTDQYFAIAKETNYDEGYGGIEIAGDLIIKMKDGAWFRRREYDGSEWFELNAPPARPANKIEDLKVLKHHNAWSGLEKINQYPDTDIYY